MLHEAIYFGERMSHTLLCPNQLRNNGLIVDDVPQQFDRQSQHCIRIPSTGSEESLHLPLEMYGVISYLTSRRPSAEEIKECTHVELTSAEPLGALFTSLCIT